MAVQHSKLLLSFPLYPFPEFSSVLHQSPRRHFIQTFLCYLQVGKNKLHSIWPLGNPLLHVYCISQGTQDLEKSLNGIVDVDQRVRDSRIYEEGF